MKKLFKTNFLTLWAILLISSLSLGQGSIVFSPSNPSVCSGESVSISAQFIATPPPALNFPYTKLTGTEIYVSTSGSNTTGNGTLANPYLTIQHAISNAVNGQIVTILPGTYTGSGNVNISTQGKQITVQSDQGPITTIIDCALNGRGFLINQGETMTTIIKGLSIINGKTNAAPLLYGSGIFVEDNSGVKILDCFFINNQEGCIQFGDTEVSGPQSGIENCSFIENIGRCISVSKKSYYTTNCFFYKNTSTTDIVANGHLVNPPQAYTNCIFKCNSAAFITNLGHGKTLSNSLLINNITTYGTSVMATTFGGLSIVDHCTFYNNTCNYSDSPWGDHIGEVKSSIFYPGIARNHVSGRQVSIPYSNSLGDGISGNGNIQGNPLFVDPSNYNFNLAAGSPCIGTGASGSNMGADMSLFPAWMFNFLEHYSGSFDNILWENGQTTDTITLLINQSRYVSVQFSNCGTTYTDSVWVEVNNLPTINAGNDTSTCFGSEFTLSATGGVDYVWSNNIQNGVPFQVNSASWFHVAGTDSNGCSALDSIYVSVIDPTITAQETAFCFGDSTTLSVNNNLSIWWSDGTTNQSSIQVQPPQITTYSVTVSDGVGTCTDSITIQVNNPQINAGSDLSVCEGETAALTATGADTYAWDNGVVNGQPFTPTVDGYYTVTGTDTLGCSNTVSVFLDVLQPTSSTISPTSCNTYTAPDNEVYTNSGQYTAIIQNAAGCDSTITINLTVNNSNSGIDSKTACDSYTWIDGNTYTTSTNSPTFTLQNAFGCDSVVTLNLTINKLQGLNAGNDITACQGDNITLTALGASTYSWTSGATNGVAFVPPTGTTIYTVTGTDDNGCTATDAVSVLVEYCLDIPGGVSPNGDNANDTWTITGLNQYPDAKVLVFDRWGQKVFSGDAANPTWDGTYEGKELPTADYYYIIELGNGEKFNGVVTLKK